MTGRPGKRALAILMAALTAVLILGPVPTASAAELYTGVTGNGVGDRGLTYVYDATSASTKPSFWFTGSDDVFMDQAIVSMQGAAVSLGQAQFYHGGSVYTSPYTLGELLGAESSRRITFTFINTRDTSRSTTFVIEITAQMVRLSAPASPGSGATFKIESPATGDVRNAQEIAVTPGSSAQLLYYYFNVTDAGGAKLALRNISTTHTSAVYNATSGQLVLGFVPATQVGDIVVTLIPADGSKATDVTFKFTPSAANTAPGLVYSTTSNALYQASPSGLYAYATRSQLFALSSVASSVTYSTAVTLTFKPALFGSTGAKASDIPAGSAVAFENVTGGTFTSSTGAKLSYDPIANTVSLTYYPYVQGKNPIRFNMKYNGGVGTVTLSSAYTASQRNFNVALSASAAYVGQSNEIRAVLTTAAGVAETGVQVSFAFESTSAQGTLTATSIQSAAFIPGAAGTYRVTVSVPAGYTLLNGDATSAGYYVDPDTNNLVYGTPPKTKKTFVITAVAGSGTGTGTGGGTAGGTVRIGKPMKSGITVTDASGRTLGTLTASQITVTGESGSRLAFDFNGVTGYVPKALIDVSTVQQAGGGSGTGTVYGLNIKNWCSFRATASASGRRLFKLYPKDTLTVYSNANGWSYALCNGTLGYVETQYLKR